MSNYQSIDSFPLCVLWNVVFPETLRIAYKTDIAVYLHQINSSKDSFKIYIENANGVDYDVAYIESTARWYKIQIYRHDGVVDFYIDGKFKKTYNPINSGHISNKISFGTMSANTNGEVFYDDVIVSTPPVGEHPRLLFDKGDLATLRKRKDDNITLTYLGVTHAQIWDSLKAFTDYFVNKI